MSLLHLSAQGLSGGETDLLMKLLDTCALQLADTWCFTIPDDCDVLVIDAAASYQSDVVENALVTGQPLLIGYHRSAIAARARPTRVLRLNAPVLAVEFYEVLNAAAQRLLSFGIQASRDPATTVQETALKHRMLAGFSQKRRSLPLRVFDRIFTKKPR